MDTELDLDLDSIEQNTEKNLKIKERFGKLSEKVTLSNKEKEDALAKAKALEDEKSSMARELAFHKDFSKSASKYQNASEYQDKIFEKVKLGYSTEDAIVSVLNANGKLTQPAAQVAPAPSKSIEGGSALSALEGEKPIEKMTRAEKLSSLQAAESRGEITNT